MIVIIPLTTELLKVDSKADCHLARLHLDGGPQAWLKRTLDASRRFQTCWLPSRINGLRLTAYNIPDVERSKRTGRRSLGTEHSA
jgi:hypothetical protein